MFTKVSVLVPTRGRVERLRTLLDSYEQTTADLALSELVFRVDEDDPATHDFLQFSRHALINGSRGKGYEDMPSFFNELARFAEGDVLMCGNDDMVFRTPGWASRVLAAANEYPDGLFDLGVSTYNEDHYPFSIVSRKVVDALGFIWDPRIFWGDIFLRDVMGAFGRAVKLPTVEIEHDWMGHHPDATFDEARQQEFLQRDPTYWSGTHARAVEEAVARLREVA